MAWDKLENIEFRTYKDISEELIEALFERFNGIKAALTSIGYTIGSNQVESVYNKIKPFVLNSSNIFNLSWIGSSILLATTATKADGSHLQFYWADSPHLTGNYWVCNTSNYDYACLGVRTVEKTQKSFDGDYDRDLCRQVKFWCDSMFYLFMDISERIEPGSSAMAHHQIVFNFLNGTYEKTSDLTAPSGTIPIFQYGDLNISSGQLGLIPMSGE